MPDALKLKALVMRAISGYENRGPTHAIRLSGLGVQGFRVRV